MSIDIEFQYDKHIANFQSKFYLEILPIFKRNN